MLSHHLLPDKYYLMDHQYVDWPSMFTTTSFTLTHRQEEVRAEWGKAKTSGNQAERMDIEVQKPMKNLEQANSFIHRLYLYRALRGCLHACRWVSVGAWQTRWSRPIQGERGRCEVALLCFALPYPEEGFSECWSLSVDKKGVRAVAWGGAWSPAAAKWTFPAAQSFTCCAIWYRQEQEGLPSTLPLHCTAARSSSKKTWSGKAVIGRPAS